MAPSKKKSHEYAKKNASDEAPEENPSKRLKTDRSTATSDEPTKAPLDDAKKTAEDRDSELSSPPNPNADDAETKDATGANLQITQETGDLFSAPKNTLLIHACNCKGSWGGGIAAVFKYRYPEAYKTYKAHCDEHGFELLGTAQLISPMEDSEEQSSKKESSQKWESSRNGESSQKKESSKKRKVSRKDHHFVGALYTSRGHGRTKDKPDMILSATGRAMTDLLGQVTKWNAGHKETEQIAEVWMCKINSQLFAVPWEETMAVLEKLDGSDFDTKTIKVVSRK